MHAIRLAHEQATVDSPGAPLLSRAFLPPVPLKPGGDSARPVREMRLLNSPDRATCDVPSTFCGEKAAMGILTPRVRPRLSSTPQGSWQRRIGLTPDDGWQKKLGQLIPKKLDVRRRRASRPGPDASDGQAPAPRFDEFSGPRCHRVDDGPDSREDPDLAPRHRHNSEPSLPVIESRP